MSHKFMVINGTINSNGRVNMNGFYSVPDNPDSGWRTEIVPDTDSFEIKMHYVSSEGEENIAVESRYSRE